MACPPGSGSRAPPPPGRPFAGGRPDVVVTRPGAPWGRSRRPIRAGDLASALGPGKGDRAFRPGRVAAGGRRWEAQPRSEEHTSELQSRENLVCRLLLEKKKGKTQQRGMESLHDEIE